MLSTLLFGLFIAACIVLIAAVLLQPGKADAGALFTSNISSTAFGARGTQTVLAKITIGAAASFMLLAFLLSQPAITGTRSVLETVAAPAASPENNQAAAPAAEPNQTANANAAVVVNANAAAAAPAANAAGNQNK